MTVQHALLGLLHDEPRHGYELKQAFDRILSPQRAVPFGQVYASLARLERDGRIAVESVERAEGPDRKRYSITEAGRATLESWLAEPLAPEPHLQADLYVKVVLAILLGQSLDDLSLAQLNRGQRLLSRLENGETFECPDGSGGGYDDLRVGAQVVVSDGSGTVLATSR